MSQMFETDISSLLPDAPQTDKGHIADLRTRVAQLEQDQLRLLDLLEKLVETEKTRAKAFDQLHERIRLAEDLANVRQQGMNLLRERVEMLEQEVRNG